MKNELSALFYFQRLSLKGLYKLIRNKDKIVEETKYAKQAPYKKIGFSFFFYMSLESKRGFEPDIKENETKIIII